jgi:hypothetical protein
VPESGHRRTKFRPKYRQISAKQAGSGRIWLLIQPDLAKTARIRPNMTGSGQNGRDPAGYDLIRPLIRKIPATFAKLWFLHFVIFSCGPNTEKYFRENHFFWK